MWRPLHRSHRSKNWLTKSKIAGATALLREHPEWVTGVMTRDDNGIGFFPIYFSRQARHGQDMR